MAQKNDANNPLPLPRYDIVIYVFICKTFQTILIVNVTREDRVIY